MTDRQLYSIESEESFIGALLLDPKRYHDVSEVRADAFVSPKAKTAYRAIQELSENNQPVDVITVAEHLSGLSQEGFEEIGGLDYLVSLHTSVPGSSNIGAYAKAIQEKAKERGLYNAAVQIQSILMEEGLSTEERFQEAEAIFTSAGGEPKKSNTVTEMPEALKDFVDFLEWRFENPGIHGIKTGFKTVDDRLQGLKPGEVYILAARPAMGKTTYALNVALAAALSKKKVYISSLEMPRRQLIQRLVSMQGRIGLKTLKDASKIQDEEWVKLTSIFSVLRNTNITIDDQGALDVNELRSRCRRAKRNQGLDLIVIDYLQLLEDRTASNRFDVVSSVSRKIKSLAKELECPIIALSQLSRKCEERNDKRPILSDLRESGQIEQDADVIQFLYRDEVYNADSERKGIAEVITAKYRDGEIGTDYLAFIGAQSRFGDLEYQPEPQELAPKQRRGFDL